MSTEISRLRRSCALVNIIIITVVFSGITISRHRFWFSEYECASGTITKITPDDHGKIYSDFSVKSTVHHFVDSGLVANYAVGDTIAIFYRTDDPRIATYDQSKFSVSESMSAAACGSLLFTAFIWIIAYHLAAKTIADKPPE